MTISVQLNNEESMLFEKYAEKHNMSLSDLIRQAIMERIEDEYDLKLYNEAMEEFKKNPVTYSHEEMKKMLELD